MYDKQNHRNNFARFYLDNVASAKKVKKFSIKDEMPNIKQDLKLSRTRFSKRTTKSNLVRVRKSIKSFLTFRQQFPVASSEGVKRARH